MLPLFACLFALSTTVDSAFYIRNCNYTRYVLDLADQNPCAEARVIVCPWLGRASQMWEFYNLTMIRNVYSGYFLDVRNDNGMGADIVVWPGHGGKNQQWAYQFDKSMRNGRNLFLDVADNYNAPGTQVIAYNHTGKNNQCWQLIPA